MRLIDGDALVAQLEADAEQMEEPLIKMCTYAAINDVKHAPTIEPERKVGKWILADAYDAGKRYRCSECLSFALKTDDGQENLSDYCPVCGVKMKGETNDKTTGN